MFLGGDGEFLASRPRIRVRETRQGLQHDGERDYPKKGMSRREFLWRSALIAGGAAMAGIPMNSDQLTALAAERPEQLPGDVGRLPTASGQWWQYRADQHLSGRCQIKGGINAPAIRWSHSIASRETLLVAAFEKGPESIDLPITDVAATASGLTWRQILEQWREPGPYGAAWLDLDGDGRLTPCNPHFNQKIGKVLPEVPGLQLIEAEPKGYPRVAGVYKGTLRLKTRENRQWVTRWH